MIMTEIKYLLTRLRRDKRCLGIQSRVKLSSPSGGISMSCEFVLPDRKLSVLEPHSWACVITLNLWRELQLARRLRLPHCSFLLHDVNQC